MSTLSQRIATLQKQRGEKIKAYEDVVNKAAGEDRDITDDEQTALDALKDDVGAVDKQLGKLEEAEKIIARSAKPVIPAQVERTANDAGRLATVDPRSREFIHAARMDDYPGAGFTRMAISCAIAGPYNAAAYARRRWGSEEFAKLVDRAAFGLDDMLQRAVIDPMSTDEAPGSAGGAGSLVPIVYMGSEFIELLRARQVIGRLKGVRTLQFGGAGTLLIPKQTGGVSGGYVGEGGLIKVQRLNFDQLRLTPAKIAVIVPQTSELLRRSDPSSEQLVRDDLLLGTATTVDGVFLSTAAAGAGPAGILNGVAENTAGELPDAATIGTDASIITAALRAMVTALRGANVPMIAPVWIMNPRTKEFLRLFTTDLGIMPFKNEVDNNLLLGYPIVDSTTVPLPFNAVSGDSIWILVDAAQLLYAEDMLPTVDASAEASIQVQDTPGSPALPANLVSAFQQDMVFMRLRASHTWNRRHDEAVTWAIVKV